MSRSGSGWLVALAAVALLGVTNPDPGADHLVSWTRGAVGSPAATADLGVVVEGVALGDSAATAHGRLLAAAGVVVAVELRGSALVEEVNFVVEARSADGRWYAQRTENPTVLGSAPAGFTRIGSAVFVVPPERVAGLELAVTPSGRSPVNHTRGVLVDLGLTGAEPATGTVQLAGARTEVTR